MEQSARMCKMAYRHCRVQWVRIEDTGNVEDTIIGMMMIRRARATKHQGNDGERPQKTERTRMRQILVAVHDTSYVISPLAAFLLWQIERPRLEVRMSLCDNSNSTRKARLDARAEFAAACAELASGTELQLQGVSA
mmetsp:Transcript_29923/g.69001  ORF Transcript_29923/g.69001 Transcript_29923/m.69001 type:complete len:137 (-) Transcript_29923:114-524(-)